MTTLRQLTVEEVAGILSRRMSRYHMSILRRFPNALIARGTPDHA